MTGADGMSEDYTDFKEGAKFVLSEAGIYWAAEHVTAVSMIELAAIWFKCAAERDWQPRDDKGLVVDPKTFLERLRIAIEKMPA